MRGISPSFVLLVASSASAAAAAAAAAADQPSCSNGLYMIVARGSDEPPGTGVTGNLTTKIAAEIKDSQVVAVNYPATFDDYEGSEGQGVDAMEALVSNYSAACPGDKIAILGYSQGAQVAMDAICGGIGGIFNSDAPISAQIMNSSVVAVIAIGDPTHVANLTYDKGTSQNNGIFPRNNTSACLKYANLLTSYCDTGDVYCDAGQNISVHSEYFTKYGDEIVSGVVSQFQKAVNSSANATASPAASATGGNSSSNNTGPSATSSPSAASALVPATSSLLFGVGLCALLTALSHIL